MFLFSLQQLSQTHFTSQYLSKTNCNLPCARPTYDLRVQDVHPRVAVGQQLMELQLTELQQQQQQQQTASMSEAAAAKMSYYSENLFGISFFAPRGKWTVKLYPMGSAVRK